MPFTALLYSGLVQLFNRTRNQLSDTSCAVIVTKAAAKYTVNKLHDLQTDLSVIIFFLGEV